MSDTRLLSCSQCGAVNRVATDKLAEGFEPVCGRCHAALSLNADAAPAASNGGPVTVTDATFAAEVEKSPLPVVVDMWAPWCGPCRAIAPMIDELAVELAGRVRFAKVNVDQNPETAMRFEVRRIPVLVVFKDGKEVDRIEGLRPKAEVAERLGQLV